ncbi:biosynthetic-type acetolactate synthase large subunit [Abyssisolibacter fermentans]|uniref:biosynthetic-type acetolactate synthase large subunit n=1 Tax=Abyssisolibacter fermentans TaxID=1766203 RepID=UPI000832FA31|nr:biosynthetic-type acetolactate synthase large subunit [Abyssisolibacter fermentans]
MRLNGAEIVLHCLKKQNVDTIFGYPGGAVIPLYDELYKMNNEFNHMRCAHEQGCVHAADGYARSTGNVGVCFVTSGPGATNAVTGIATAYMDSVPLVVIAGQVPTSLLGRDSFQEIDITGITISITKHNYLVKDIIKLPEIINEAFSIAKTGRPGPVLIDIPKDIFLQETEYVNGQTDDEECYTKKITSKYMKKAANMINNAKRPVIYAGGGVITANSSKKLIDFAEKTSIPVVNTLMGLGNFPRNNELSLGMVGMHGFKETNRAVNNSDLIIALGARFSDRVIGKSDSFASNAKIIHIDIDETEVNKNIDSELTLIGDMKDVLDELLNYVEEKNRADWVQEINSWKIEDGTRDLQFIPKNIFKALQKHYNENTIIATDVGQHQMWTAQYWDFSKPRTFITSGGLGTMGFGLGAALGAQVGNPDKNVLLITGDGSFRMNCNELSTVSKYNLPVVIILFNNSTLGMVRQWQTLFSGSRYSETNISQEVNYVALAQAYGIKGYQVNTITDLEKTLEEVSVFKDNKAVMIECLIDKNEMVLPIVPPGMPINNQII